MNKVILVGNLTRDPELRQTPQGVSVARFTIAVSRRYQKDGQQQTDFISCVAWRNTADFISKYFHKGSGIQLCGSIQSRSWDGQDGQKHYATEVVADEVSFNGPKSQNSNDGGFSAPQSFGAGFDAPQASQSSASADFGADFDAMGFADLDGSEDDLPF